jgi:hypothetical protein
MGAVSVLRQQLCKRNANGRSREYDRSVVPNGRRSITYNVRTSHARPRARVLQTSGQSRSHRAAPIRVSNPSYLFCPLVAA